MKEITNFTVIVPIYNVENALRRCLESIVNQTFTDYECILINDCSPDKSGVICDEYAEKDNRFKIIHKPQNEGAGKARKSGYETAHGDFLVFVDGDDWLELNALESLHKKFMETNADIIRGGTKSVFKKKTIIYTPPSISKNESALEYYFLNDVKALWGCGFRKNLFDGCIFPTVKRGQDIMTSLQLFSKVDKSKIQVVDTPLYNYDVYISGFQVFKRNKYDSFKDHSSGYCRLWMESYIRSINADEKVIDAFNYDITSLGIFPYMKSNLSLKSKEIRELYKRYYLPCSYKKKLRWMERVCLLLLVKCFLFGKITIYFFNIGAGMVKKMTKI